MKLVADANILFALSSPESVTEALVSQFPLDLYSPKFALDELEKHKEELENKTGREFETILKLLKSEIEFVDTSKFSNKIEKVSSKISDKKDILYLALALKLNCPVWSNDKHFKEQSLVEVLTTSELINFLEFEPE